MGMYMQHQMIIYIFQKVGRELFDVNKIISINHVFVIYNSINFFLGMY